jgi:hypothetical protein
MLRVNEMPEIEVHIVASTAEPGGIGEPSTALAAGSLASQLLAPPPGLIPVGPRRHGATEAAWSRAPIGNGHRGRGDSQRTQSPSAYDSKRRPTHRTPSPSGAWVVVSSHTAP